MEFKIEEALRYLGADENADKKMCEEVEAVAQKLTSSITPRYTYRVFSVRQEKQQIFLEESNITLPGETAKRMLSECSQAVVMACTLGARFDALLQAEQARSMARAVILDVCGSVWVEAGCDEAEREIAQYFPGCYLTDRFSPGYGDLPLDLQPSICAALNAGRRLGIQVTDSLLLNPLKSVTAIIGLSDKPQMARIRGCDYCIMKETCNLRKRGKNCAP